MERYVEFVEKRISLDLFESKELIEEMIVLSGGSPRQLLQIINQTRVYSGFDKTILEKTTFDKAMRILSNEMSLYLRKEQLELLNELKKDEEQIPFDDEIMQALLEDLIIMEYNDGSNRQANPLVAMSKIYKQYVK